MDNDITKLINLLNEENMNLLNITNFITVSEKTFKPTFILKTKDKDIIFKNVMDVINYIILNLRVQKLNKILNDQKR